MTLHARNAAIQAQVERASALLRDRQSTQAKAVLEEVLSKHPMNFEVLHLLGLIAGQAREFPRAVDLLGRALELDPRNPAVLCTLGNAQGGLGDQLGAIVSYDKALALKRNYPEAWTNRGNALLALRRFDEAIANYDKAIALNPMLVIAHSNRGYALQECNRFGEALASYDMALAIKPAFAEAITNRGYTKQRMQELDAAVADYDRALAVDPNFAEAHWNKALALLVGGNFKQGLPLYEWRWRRAHSRRRNFTQPLWLGAGSLEGKTILLHSEQGLGDTIQMCRYARFIADRGARVILEVPKPLLALLSGLDGVGLLVEKGTALPPFDCHCPMMSLPLAHRTTLGSIPNSTAYLCSDPAKVRRWEARLGPKGRPRIGLAWSGSAVHMNDVQRSIALSALIPRLPGQLEYFSLQKEVREMDGEVLLQHPEIRHAGTELADFAETAALCELMDVVVSVDTSVAHLSGALGKPTWLLLPYHPDWRWHLRRDDSPWYPSVSLYRQTAAGDWTAVLEKVKADLERLPALCFGGTNSL